MNKELLLDRIQELTHPLSPIESDHQTKLQSISDIRCVAFDFYGTMFISAVGDIGVDEEQQDSSIAYFAESLRDTGFKITDDEASQRGKTLFEETINNLVTAAQNNGIDHPEPDLRAVWWDVLTKLLSENRILGSLTKETAVRFGIEFEFRINDIWPVPNLKSLLSSLLDDNLTLGIISNSQYYTPLAFESFYEQSPKDFGFDPNLLIWSYKTGYKKPSNHFYRFFTQAAEKQNISPQEVLYVGNDIYKDIKPAKELGMYTALYVGDQRSMRHEEKDLENEDVQPDLIIDNLHQIQECLD